MITLYHHLLSETKMTTTVLDLNMSMISEIESLFCTHFSGKVSFVLYAADSVMDPTGVPIEPTLKDWKPEYNNN